MPKNIQLSEKTYDKLTSLMRPKETYSEVVERILIMFDKVGELRGLLDSQIASLKGRPASCDAVENARLERADLEQRRLKTDTSTAEAH